VVPRSSRLLCRSASLLVGTGGRKGGRESLAGTRRTRSRKFWAPGRVVPPNYISKSSDVAGQNLRSFHDHWHYLDQLVRFKFVKLINATSDTRARSTRTAGATTSSAPSHTKILSKRLSGSRRCTRLGSRSSRGSEPRRRRHTVSPFKPVESPKARGQVGVPRRFAVEGPLHSRTRLERKRPRSPSIATAIFLNYGMPP
jgi:hypothetical protein